MKIGVSGKYKLRVLNQDLSLKDETPWSSNIITAVGLNFLVGGSAADQQPLRGVAGSGNAAPALGNTALANYLGPCNSVISINVDRNTTTAPYSVTKTIVFRSEQGGVVGNVSEVGVAIGTTASAASTLISRSLVVDSQGAQTTVPVQADEYLEIVWEFSMYMTQTSGNFNMTIDGAVTSFAYVIRPSNIATEALNGGWGFNGTTAGQMLVNLYPFSTSLGSRVFNSQTLGGVTDIPAGAASTVDPMQSVATYTSGTFFRDFTINFGPDSGNFNIGAMTIGMSACAAQMSFAPTVNKVQGKTFAINFRVSVANYTP